MDESWLEHASAADLDALAAAVRSGRLTAPYAASAVLRAGFPPLAGAFLAGVRNAPQATLAWMLERLTTTAFYRDQLAQLAGKGRVAYRARGVARLTAVLEGVERGTRTEADLEQVAEDVARGPAPALTTAPPAAALVGLAERVATDPGAPFTEEVLDAAAELAAVDAAAYERLVAMLRAAGVRLTSWERRVRQRRDARRTAPLPAPALPAQKIAGPYLMDADGIATWTRDEHGAVVRDEELSDFPATIVAQVEEIGAADTRCVWEISATVQGRACTTRVLAEEFASMRWVSKIGADAVIPAGRNTTERLREAIQRLSRPIPRREVYTFTGWHKVQSAWVYLHGGGAIGASGPVEGLEVRLDPRLAAMFVLPSPPRSTELVRCVRAAVELLTLHPEVTAPLFAAPWRAALGHCATTVYLSAAPEAGKTLLASLAQRHFGSTMGEKNLPASWMSSTAASLNMLRGVLGDTIFAVDDFVLTGGHEDARQQNKAELIVRAQYGGTGARRLARDGSLRAEPPVRSLLLATGEVVPRGHSLRTRMTVVDLASRLPVDLGPHDAAASAGTYARAMAAFIEWLAPRLDDARVQLATEVARDARALAASVADQRTCLLLADLAAGARHLLAFAQAVGALTAVEIDTAWSRIWNALAALVGAQRARQAEQEPATRFLTLLGAAIGAGRCHIARLDGGAPKHAHAWGWRSSGGIDGPRGSGERVGWMEHDRVYLLREVALAAAQRLASESGDALALTPHVLTQRLHEKGLLADTEMASRGTLTVRKRVGGRDKTGLVCVLSENLGLETEAPNLAGIGSSTSSVGGVHDDE